MKPQGASWYDSCSIRSLSRWRLYVCFFGFMLRYWGDSARRWCQQGVSHGIEVFTVQASYADQKKGSCSPPPPPDNQRRSLIACGCRNIRALLSKRKEKGFLKRSGWLDSDFDWTLHIYDRPSSSYTVTHWWHHPSAVCSRCPVASFRLLS